MPFESLPVGSLCAFWNMYHWSAPRSNRVEGDAALHEFSHACESSFSAEGAVKTQACWEGLIALLLDLGISEDLLCIPVFSDE